MENLTIEDIKYVTNQVVRVFLNWNEPVPEFNTRKPEVLESCLVNIFQKYAGEELYPGTSQKAAVLFYSMIKNHPFQNGNKRIAIMSLFYFLVKNERWLQLEKQGTYLHNLSKWVAESNPKGRDEVITQLENIISKNLVKDLHH